MVMNPEQAFAEMWNTIVTLWDQVYLFLQGTYLGSSPAEWSGLEWLLTVAIATLVIRETWLLHRALSRLVARLSVWLIRQTSRATRTLVVEPLRRLEEECGRSSAVRAFTWCRGMGRRPMEIKCK